MSLAMNKHSMNTEILWFMHKSQTQICKHISSESCALTHSKLAFGSVINITNNGIVLIHNHRIYNSIQNSNEWMMSLIHTLENSLDSMKQSSMQKCIYGIARKTIETIHEKLSKYENETTVILAVRDTVFFMKDDVGTTSLGYTLNPFCLSHTRYSNEIDPMCIYSYNRRSGTLDSWLKHSSTLVNAYISKINSISKYITIEKHSEYAYLKKHLEILNDHEFIGKYALENNLQAKDEVNEFIQIFHNSVMHRIVSGDICIFFSGGVDSMLLAVFMHHSAAPKQKIYLINTSFGQSSDRDTGKMRYEELCLMFKQRTFVFIENDIGIKMLREAETHIYELIYPKTKPMDFNIAATLFFSAKEARKYSSVAYAGSGADELFGGYSRYTKCEFRDSMLFDLLTISHHNLCRDNRVMSDNQIECRYPFLDSKLIQYSLSISDNMIFGSGLNKLIIREVLRRYGFDNAANVPKKAMQYGSGAFKMENKHSTYNKNHQ
ncbi:asparagine synthase [Ordospora colligata]|nr:asparagine synthase [Ordospora colligata]